MGFLGQFSGPPPPPILSPGVRRTPGGGWKASGPHVLGLRRVLGFSYLPFGFQKLDPDPQKSQRGCSGRPESPGSASPGSASAGHPASRGMPGEKVLGRAARTADRQAQTTSPRIHCTPQPRAGRGCPWQQRGSTCRAGTRKRSGAGGGTERDQREAETQVGRRRGETGGDLTGPTFGETLPITGQRCTEYSRASGGKRERENPRDERDSQSQRDK